MERKIKFGLLELPVITYKEEDMFVSEVPIFHIASQGKTIEDSIKNLKEAVELYFEGEDIEKIIKNKVSMPTSLITTTIIFDTRTRHVVSSPISQNSL